MHQSIFLGELTRPRARDLRLYAWYLVLYRLMQQPGNHEHQANESPTRYEFQRVRMPSLNLSPCNCLFGLLLALALLLQHLLDDLLLLDEEGTHDPIPHAVAASGAAIDTLDRLLWLRDLGILAWSQGRDLFGHLSAH